MLFEIKAYDKIVYNRTLNIPRHKNVFQWVAPPLKSFPVVKKMVNMLRV